MEPSDYNHIQYVHDSHAALLYMSSPTPYIQVNSLSPAKSSFLSQPFTAFVRISFITFIYTPCANLPYIIALPPSPYNLIVSIHLTPYIGSAQHEYLNPSSNVKSQHLRAVIGRDVLSRADQSSTQLFFFT